MLKLTPTSELRAWAAKRYASQCKKWLAGDIASFPLTVTLCDLTEREFMQHQAQVLAFFRDWKTWDGPGALVNETWRWARVGEHTLPAHITFDSPRDVAAAAGQLATWTRARNRVHALASITSRQPELFAKLYDLLEGLPVPDWRRLRACVRYFGNNPDCGLYMRQLPIEGVDTKWVGGHLPELTKVLNLVHDTDEDFYALTGVRKPDHLNHVVVRVLCPQLRQLLGGLGHLDVPVSSLRSWTIRPGKVLFVENLESGIALGDLPGTIALVGKGNAVTTLADINWIRTAKTFYWGDLDTHGLAIFSRLLAKLPGLVPLLMDAKTLLQHKAMWVEEPSPHGEAIDLPAEQQAVYRLLTTAPLMKGVRLEQERIPWPAAWQEIEAALTA